MSNLSVVADDSSANWSVKRFPPDGAIRLRGGARFDGLVDGLALFERARRSARDITPVAPPLFVSSKIESDVGMALTGLIMGDLETTTVGLGDVLILIIRSVVTELSRSANDMPDELMSSSVLIGENV